VQLFFFAQLFSLVNKVEVLEREQADRVLIMAAGDEIIMEFGTTWTNIVCKLFGSSAYKLDPEAFKTRMDRDVARLQPLVHDRPDIAALVDEAQKTIQLQYDLYKEVLAAGDTDEINTRLPPVAIFRVRAKFAKIAVRAAALKEKVEHQISLLTDTYYINERKRANLKTEIFIGVAVDFTVTLLLLLAFLSDITKRLNILVANAHLIPTGEALYERVSGSDELAVLDGVLHRDSEELQKAKEYRKSLMEMVAHDLRSPLSLAMSTVDMLVTPAVRGSEEQSQEHVARLRSGLVQLIGFVEDLLTIDRLESGKLELELSQFKIHSLIDEAFDRLAVKAQSRYIKLVKEGEDFEVVADQARIAQVVMNLLTNAIKHSPDHGTVRLLTARREHFVKVSVIDQGKGIPEAEQKRIFEKFAQSKDAKQKEGFGLGLAICKLIIDAHQGAIGLTSKVGERSEFWFTLPIDADV
jgi:signal transduction histidine kinase